MVVILNLKIHQHYIWLILKTQHSKIHTIHPMRRKFSQTGCTSSPARPSSRMFPALYEDQSGSIMINTGDTSLQDRGRPLPFQHLSHLRFTLTRCLPHNPTPQPPGFKHYHYPSPFQPGLFPACLLALLPTLMIYFILGTDQQQEQARRRKEEGRVLYVSLVLYGYVTST